MMSPFFGRFSQILFVKNGVNKDVVKKMLEGIDANLFSTEKKNTKKTKMQLFLLINVNENHVKIFCK